MADVRNFKPRLSSSRMFNYVKGESKDFNNKKVDDKFFNKMTASYESQDYLEDSMQFSLTAPVIYQLDLLKEDLDDIHSHLSESKFTSKVQKYPVVDVTEEFFVSGVTKLKGNTTIDGFTDIRGDFKVNGNTISNLKPSLEFSDSLRAKTLVSSSAQISSDISGSFTSLSASIATDINNAGGSVDFERVGSTLAPDADDSRDLGFGNRQWRTLYLDGTAYIDVLSADSFAKPPAPVVLVATTLKSSLVAVTGLHTLVLNSSNALSITGLIPAHSGQEITIMNIGSGAVTITRSTKNQARTIYGSSNITINQHQAYKFVCNPNDVWYQIS
tara:strand:+ start:2141 stop:3127 length:987 start_codon:yes stop_codon:yes gene_type:complete